jgi:hypothetical protein
MGFSFNTINLLNLLWIFPALNSPSKFKECVLKIKNLDIKSVEPG